MRPECQKVIFGMNVNVLQLQSIIILKLLNARHIRS